MIMGWTERFPVIWVFVSAPELPVVTSMWAPVVAGKSQWRFQWDMGSKSMGYSYCGFGACPRHTLTPLAQAPLVSWALSPFFKYAVTIRNSWSKIIRLGILKHERSTLNCIWLVVFCTFVIFHFLYGMSSFPLTFICFKMVIAPPTRWCYIYHMHSVSRCI